MSEKNGPLEVTGDDHISVCKCMQSNYWPYCDGTHHEVGGGWPERVELDKNKTYSLCQCQKTKNPPFCDGSHNS